jgi:hypothetical protein
LCRDAGTIQLRDPQLPFFQQLGCLTVPSLGARKHPFCVCTLPNHMI